MTTSCLLGCLYITDLHHCILDAGPTSCSFDTSTPIPTLTSLYNAFHLPQPLGRWLLLFSVENQMPLPGEGSSGPALNWSLLNTLFSSDLSFLTLYWLFVFLLILFFPIDKAVADFFSHATLWGRTGPLPSNESVNVCWLTQEGYIVISNFASSYMRRVASALSSIQVMVQKSLWYASNFLSKMSIVFILQSLIVCPFF